MQKRAENIKNVQTVQKTLKPCAKGEIMIKRPWLTPEVKNRIRELMGAGWGSRRIRNKLVEENLCEKSPRTIYTVMCEISEEDEKKLQKDDTIQRLKTDVEIYESTESVRRKRIEDERLKQKEITSLYQRMAKTPDGLKKIFNSQQELLKFVQQVPGKNDDWQRFVELCEADNLDLAETLFKIVGPLKKYDNQRYVPLRNYIAFHVSRFVAGKIKIHTYPEYFVCQSCGNKLTKVITYNSDKIHCYNCGEIFYLTMDYSNVRFIQRGGRWRAIPRTLDLSRIQLPAS